MILSLFPGIDLLGRGFEAAGFCVVRGPDCLWGRDIRNFSLLGSIGSRWSAAKTNRCKFQGIIGGSPCQDFSRARRATLPTGIGMSMLREFRRLVTEGQPDWWLLENVPGVPDVPISGYIVQRFNLNAKECGLKQNRLRAFQFGSYDGHLLVIPRSPPALDASRTAMASEGSRGRSRRSFADFCELQGLPRDFDLPGMTLAGKYRAVGNGVPVPMAVVIARAIINRHQVRAFRMCICHCGRPVHGKQLMATAACRKRMERERRDSAGMTVPGLVTAIPGQSQLL
jgi:DNA (cytosine-5)-methyltransferase 1